MKKHLKNFFVYLSDFFEIVVIISTVFLLIYLFVAQLLEVNGDSMFPTFKDKEQIVAEKVSIKFKPLERGEIIIFKSLEDQNRLLIKRLIGLPTETIKISNGKVYIDGNILNEDYLSGDTVTLEGKLMKENVDYKIAEYSYVFMGDNRGQSTDSRDYGAVSEQNIVGRGVLVYYPLSDFKLIN